MEEFIENYAQIPQSKRVLYALIAGVVIVVLFLLGVHNEEQDRFERMQNQVTKLDRDVTKKRAYVQNMEKYKQRFQQLELSWLELKQSYQTPRMSPSSYRSLATGLGMSASALTASSHLVKRPRISIPKSSLPCVSKAPITKLRLISIQSERWTVLSTLQGFECRTPPLRINV